MKIYTRTGDEGETGLFGGIRTAKDDPRISAFGTVDELNAQLGVARAAGISAAIDAVLDRLQHEMFALGAELASVDPVKSGTAYLQDGDVATLEGEIDRFEATLAPLTNFIVPGGTSGAAALHAARCVCRRAERELVGLLRFNQLRALLLVYLNRVGDLLFVLARAANAAADVDDVAWRKPGEK